MSTLVCHCSRHCNRMDPGSRATEKGNPLCLSRNRYFCFLYCGGVLLEFSGNLDFGILVLVIRVSQDGGFWALSESFFTGLRGFL